MTGNKIRARIILLLAFVLLCLTGCATDGGTHDGFVGGTSVYVITRTVPDGREIPCIAVDGYGLSCDWSKP